MTCSITAQHHPSDLPELVGFDCWVNYEPGYDCITHPCGEGEHGVHGMQLRWLLRRSDAPDAGVVQFLMYTDWLLPDSPAVSYPADVLGRALFPMAVDLGYHSPTPLYEGGYDSRDCDLLSTGSCYYDGSALSAGPVLDALLTEGGDAVWLRLADYYNETFGGTT